MAKQSHDNIFDHTIAAAPCDISDLKPKHTMLLLLNNLDENVEDFSENSATIIKVKDAATGTLAPIRDDMTQITAVNGSPRKHGNTDTVLDAFLRGAENAGATTSKISLVDIDYKNCQGCNACHKKGFCILKDDLTPIFDAVLATDILVLASPIYSMTITAEMKSFIDRGQFFWAQKFITKTLTFSRDHLRHHIGVYLGTSGQDIPHIFDAVFPVVRAFFNDAGFSYTENVFFAGMDQHGGIADWPESMTFAESEGKRIAKLI